MKIVCNSYDECVCFFMECEKKFNEEKLKNQFLEQVINLKKEFVDEVKDCVEKECEGCFSKFNDFLFVVFDFEKFIFGWNEVVDMNFKI